MRHCIYPGTFDPITYGHLDVLSRAAKLFDRVTVAIAENAGKTPLFSAADRLAMVRPNVAQFPNFVMPNEQFSYTSSSLVKQVAQFGGDITHFVPPNVGDALTFAFPKS